MHRRIWISVCLLLLAAPAFSQLQSIDLSRSSVTILVGKSGLFSGLGDDHTIQAPLSGGRIDTHSGSAEVSFHSSALRVVDPKLSPDKREEVQRRMLSADVLDASRFPEIQFQSTNIKESGSNQWEIAGLLNLHGEKHAVAMHVIWSDGHYKGTAKIKQTWFGIKPITVAGGTIKVKDEVQVDFDIVPIANRD